jgi:precorrin-6B methylase 2
MEDNYAQWRTFAFASAMDFDVFSHVASGARTAEAVAKAAGAHAPSMRRLLDAVVALGHLRRTGDTYSLTPHASTFLVRGRPLFLEAAAVLTRGMEMAWSQLTEVVRTGERAGGADGERLVRAAFPMLARSIFPQNYAAASAGVAALGTSTLKKITDILDVGAGTGVWSIPFAEAIPHARITALDYPEVIPLTREYAEKFSVAERFDYVEADLREADFGKERYDLVLLGHVVHVEGRERTPRLLERCAKALRKGGRLLIAEVVPDDDRKGSAFAMLFSLNMLLGDGDVFTLAEYRKWLKAAGFNGIRTLKVPAFSPLIVASK